MADLLDYDLYGLTLVYVDNSHSEYAVGSDEEATEAAKEYIRESVWAFRPDFILPHTILADLDVKEIIPMLSEKCESGNATLLKLIIDFDAFADDAITCDGRGHFLAYYDGEENTLDEIDEDDAKEIALLLDIPDDKWETTYVYQLT